jgi:hypothetical protein
MSRGRLVVVAAFALCACRDPQRPEQLAGSGSAATPVRAWPSNAPPRDACRTHGDCAVMVWDGPVGNDPCCDARVGYMPVARAYLEFMATYRKANCGGVTCPTPPLPGAEPACCANIGRCVAKHCVSACDDPLAHAPAISVLDPGCNHELPSADEPCNESATPKGYEGGTASAAYTKLTKCCGSLRANAPLLQYGTPSELGEAADLCEGAAARIANECAPTKLGELKHLLRGKGVPDCAL